MEVYLLGWSVSGRLTTWVDLLGWSVSGRLTTWVEGSLLEWRFIYLGGVLVEG